MPLAELELDVEEDVEDILEEEHSIEEDEDFDFMLRCFLLVFLLFWNHLAMACRSRSIFILFGLDSLGVISRKRFFKLWGDQIIISAAWWDGTHKSVCFLIGVNPMISHNLDRLAYSQRQLICRASALSSSPSEQNNWTGQKAQTEQSSWSDNVLRLGPGVSGSQEYQVALRVYTFFYFYFIFRTIILASCKWSIYQVSYLFSFHTLAKCSIAEISWYAPLHSTLP